MWGHLKISKTCDGNSKITVLDSWLHVSRKKPVKRSTFSRTGSAVVFFDRGGSLVTSPGVLHLFIYTHQMYSWKRTGKGKGRITRMSRDTSAEGRDIGYKGGEGNGSGHKYKHAKNAKYKNAKEKETKNGLDQNRANTIVQIYNIEKHKEWREKINWLSCKLFPSHFANCCSVL